MTLGQKIRQLIKSNGYRRIEDFYAALKTFFGSHSITRRTLTRLLNDHVQVSDRTLNQIAILLDIPTSSIKEGTDRDIPSTEKAITVFQYNKLAVIKGLRKDLPFAPEKLMLRPGGRTSREQDRADVTESVKWFVVFRGSVTLVLENPHGEERRTFKADDEFAFDARLPHYFESTNRRLSVIYIIHYPTRNSDLFLFDN